MKRAENLKPIAIGHFNIDKEQGGPKLLNGGNGRSTIAALRDKVNCRVFLEQRTQAQASRRFVVNDHGGNQRNRCRHLLNFNLSASPMKGKTTSTVNPSVESLILRAASWP